MIAKFGYDVYPIYTVGGGLLIQRATQNSHQKVIEGVVRQPFVVVGKVEVRIDCAANDELPFDQDQIALDKPPPSAA